MGNIGDLRVWVTFDDNGLVKATKRVKDGVKKMGDESQKQTSRMWKSFGKLGWIIAGAFSVAAIIAFSKKLLTLWSDLEETQSKFDTVFGSVAEEANRAFDDIASAVGRSSLDLKWFGASIGDLLNPLGFSEEATSKLSQEIVKLGVDLASFNNISDAQAINALTKGLLGEREALKSLGISMNQAEVNQKAYQLGIAKTGEELNAQQKALATYELYLDKTAKAQGDAVRTSASFANQLKRLQGTIKDTFANAWKDVAWQVGWILGKIDTFIQKYWAAIFQAIIEIGRTFGVVFTAIKSIVTDVMSAFGIEMGKWWEDTQSFGEIILQMFRGLGIAIRWIAFALSSFVKLVVAVNKDQMNAWRNGFKVVTSLFGAFADVAKLVASGVSQNLIAWVTNMVSGAVDKINEFIAKAERLLGVNIGKLNTIQKKEYVDLVGASKAAFDKVGEAGNEFVDEFGENTKWAFAEVKANFYQMGDEIIASNTRVKDKIVSDNDLVLKDYDSTFMGALWIAELGMWWVEDATNKAWKAWKNMAKDIKEAMKDVEDGFGDLEDANEDFEKSSEKYSEKIVEYNEGIVKWLREIKNELRELSEEYNDMVEEIEGDANNDLNSNTNDFLRDQIESQVEIEKSIKEQKEAVKELNDEFNSGNIDVEDKLEKEIELKKELEELETRLADTKLNISEATKWEGEDISELLKAERERAELSEERREALDFQQEQENVKKEAQDKIDLENAKFEESKKRLEMEQNIYKFFQEKNIKSEEELNALIATEQFKRLSTEEQNLILKLARDKLKLEEQKEELIQMQRDVASATIELSNTTHEILMSNTNAMTNEYRALIGQINGAIVKQRELNSARASKWFAWWGYT